MAARVEIHYKPQGPTLDAYIACTAQRAFIMGPLASAKTNASCWKVFRVMTQQRPNRDKIRRTRILVVRNTYSDLLTTAVKDWIEMFEPLGVYTAGGREPPTHHLDFELADGTRVVSEVIFLALDREDDVKKLRGMQCTAAWLNEVKELPFGILAMLDLRIGRYPSQADGGASWHGIFGDTNAPDTDHWYYIMAEETRPEGWKFFRQPGGLIRDTKTSPWRPNMSAENIRNTPGGHNYYVLGAQGKSDDWIAVNLGNEYGFVKEGKPCYPDFRDAVMVREFEIVKDLGLWIGMDFGLCYSSDTEVLTERGWKLFQDVDEKHDRVATLNPDGLRLEYTDINFKVEYDYVGELVEFKSQSFDFCVTPEHRTPFTNRESPDTLRWLSAAELAERTTSHKFIQLAARSWDGAPLDFCGLPDDMAASLLGWYVSEGSTETIGNSYRVSIAQKKAAPGLDALCSDPRWARLMIVWRKSKDGWRATFPRRIGARMAALGKAWDKHCPPELMAANSEAIGRFLDSYVAGDGHIRSRTKVGSGIGRKAVGEITAATVSTVLRDQLQELALKVGWTTATRVQAARVSKMADGRSIQCPDIHIVTFKRLSRGEILPEHVKHVPYAGKIYCLNVPHHTLYVRRNGRPCWNGNTPAAVIGQRAITGQWRIRHEICTEDTGIHSFADQFNLFMAKHYHGWPINGIFGDPAGGQRVAGDVDVRTSFMILAANDIDCKPAPGDNDITLRLETFAAPMRKLIDGEPGLLVHPDCRVLRKACQGGYAFKRIKVVGSDRYRDMPDKDRYSHPADAGQ